MGPQAQTGPLCLLGSHCTRALTVATVSGAAETWRCLLLKELKPVPETRPDLTRSGIWPWLTVSIMPHWVCCGKGVVTSMWHGTSGMLKSTLSSDWHRDTISFSLPPEGYKTPFKIRQGKKNHYIPWALAGDCF